MIIIIQSKAFCLLQKEAIEEAIKQFHEKSKSKSRLAGAQKASSQQCRRKGCCHC